MNELIIYFIKVNIALILFYALFRVIFYKDTFWHIRRIYLISATFISFLYPFVSLSNWLESKEPVQTFIAEWSNLQEFVVVQQTVPTFLTWENIALTFYAAIGCFLLIRVFVQLFSIFKWKKRSTKAIIQNIPVRTVNNDITPFSFFKNIYINPDLYNKEELTEILIHEKTHVQQWHSLDVLMGELLTMLCWINPAAWLLKREIHQNLEFMADNYVVKTGCNTKNYQYNLVRLALHAPDIQIVNKFNVSPLKKRIIMMNQTKTKKTGLIKYLLILPLALALVLSSNAETLLSAATSIAKEKKLQHETTAEYETTPDETVFMVVEKMPEFSGGQEAMFKYLSQNIKYPAQAAEKNIQGRVIVQFVISAVGKIEDVNIIRSIDPELDKEAIRIVESMPDWKPGEHEGKKVAVKYTLPINFALKEVEKKENPEDIVKVDKMPEFPGGQEAMFKYLSRNIKYPVEAHNNKEEGRVIVQFTVKESGKITDLNIVRSISPTLDKEAIRIVESMPDWKPGEYEGKKVAVKYTLPITFMFSDSMKETKEEADEIVVVGYGHKESSDTKNEIEIE